MQYEYLEINRLLHLAVAKLRSPVAWLAVIPQSIFKELI